MNSKIIVGILVVVLLAGIGCGGYFFWWVKTPQYSMMQLADAVHKHDLSSFQKYFDSANVASNAVNDLSGEELREIGGPTLLKRLLGFAVTRFFKPQMVDSLTKSINDFVSKTPEERAAEAAAKQQQEAQAEQSEGAVGRLVDGILNKVVDAVKPPPLHEILSDMGLTKENYRGLTGFEQSGQLCHVGLKFQSPQQTAPTIVMLELENIDDHWHVIRISNMDALARILTASPPS